MFVQPSPLGGTTADNSMLALDAYVAPGGDVVITMTGITGSFPEPNRDTSDVGIITLGSGSDNWKIDVGSDHLIACDVDALSQPGGLSDVWFVGFVQFADGSRAFSEPLNLREYFGLDSLSRTVSDSSSAPSEQLYTREEDLQIKGDFAFLGFTLLVVLVLNLGVNLFRAFRAR